MKELSVEEKAKRYDDLLVKLQKAKTDDNVCDDRYCCVIDIIVPELKESEDERTRNEIIAFVVQSIHRGGGTPIPQEKENKWIAWLEEQANHANFRNGIKIGDKVTRNKDGVLVNLSQLNRVAKKDEKQGEQNPNPCDGCINRKGCINCENGELREIEQKPAWSKKDEEYLDDIIRTLRNFVATGGSEAKRYTEEEINWLKDRVQPKQKWSEEDNIILSRIIADYERSNEEWFNAQKSLPHGRKITWLKSLRPQNRWKPSDEQVFELECVVKQNKDNMLGKNLQLLLEQLKNLK